jgi:sugar/nucleoside kinase (ribokinase family)
VAVAGDAPPVSIVGNLTIDLILRGVETLPSWGREVSGDDHRSVASGQAAYLALGLAHLGVASRLVGIVGDDPEGRTIQAELAAAGVTCGAIETTAAAPTAITVAIVRGDGERAFVSDFACQRLFDAELVDRHWASISTARALCLVGLFNLPGLPPNAAARIFARARTAGLKTVLDTGWDSAEWAPETVAGTLRLLAETDVFLPNQEEAEALTGLSDPAEAAAALQRAGADIVVVKCGANGSAGRAGDRTIHIPAHAIEVHDAVGAGDSFDAGFLYAYLEGRNVHECMQFATATAATYVSRSHDRHPNVGDVEQALAREQAGTGAR